MHALALALALVAGHFVPFFPFLCLQSKGHCLLLLLRLSDSSVVYPLTFFFVLHVKRRGCLFVHGLGGSCAVCMQNVSFLTPKSIIRNQVN